MLKKGCIFLICKEALHGQSLATQHALWASSSSIRGSLLEMQDPGPIPDLWNQNCSPKDPQVIPTSTLLFEKQGPGVALGGKGGVSQLSLNIKSVPIPFPKAALHPHPSPLRSFPSLCGTPMKGATYRHQEMRVGFIPNAKLLLPQILISGLSRGLFLEAVFYSAWRGCLASLGELGPGQSPQCEPLASVCNKECAGFTCLVDSFSPHRPCSLGVRPAHGKRGGATPRWY